jgi:hypothetical protein
LKTAAQANMLSVASDDVAVALDAADKEHHVNRIIALGGDLPDCSIHDALDYDDALWKFSSFGSLLFGLSQHQGLVIAKREEQWQERFRKIFPTFPMESVNSKAASTPGTFNNRKQRGDGVTNCYSCSSRFLICIIHWCLAAPRRPMEIRLQAVNLFTALTSQALGVIAPPFLRLQLSLLPGAGYVDVNLQNGALIMAGFWNAMGQHAEVSKLKVSWIDAQASGNYEFVKYGWDFVPPAVLVTCVLLFCTPASAFPGLSALVFLLMAQLGNILTASLHCISKPVTVNTATHTFAKRRDPLWKMQHLQKSDATHPVSVNMYKDT